MILAIGAAPTWSQTETIVLSGELAPGTGGGIFPIPACANCSPFSQFAMNESLDVAFHATVTGGTATEGIFHGDSAGVLEARVLQGEVAPGTGGGTYPYFSTRIAINAPGDIAFAKDVTGGTATSGVFIVDPAGVTVPRTLTGQIAPTTGGGTFSSVSGGARHGGASIPAMLYITQ